MMISRRQLIKSSFAAITALPFIKITSSIASTSNYGIVGNYAPELNVDYWIDRNGHKTSFKLADHQGKWIFLKGFQSWCPGCHSHGLPALKKISDAFIDNPNIAFAAIQTVFEGHSVNSIDKVRETQLQYDLKIPMGHDPGGQNGRSYTMIDYRTGGTPWMILINPDRIVVFNDFAINVDNAISYLREQTA